MESSVVLVLIGSLISLVSTLAGLYVRHWLDVKKLQIEAKQHPSRVVYDKQTEFFDKVAPTLLEVNSYVSTIDAWLGEETEDAKEKVKEAAANSSCVNKLDELLQHYYMYLPQKVLQEGNDLVSKCLVLADSPSREQIWDSADRLFSLQNTVREFVGIDALSRDLLKAFGPQTQRDGES
ncbi:MAG: hypothetical protein GTO12_06025 [Proteobacteria bacterium]|nr:hypothetical protein [Pseudomonadota bacterium]